MTSEHGTDDVDDLDRTDAAPGPRSPLPLDGGGSTVLRIVVGGQLRRRREAAGVSRELAANAIRASAAKISRLELGRVKFKERDLLDLLTVYGVRDRAERDEFLSLARQANAPGWWQRYNDLLPSWFETYLAMEQSASLIRTFEVQFVPGLLQTPAYARAVIELGHDDPADIERRIELRGRRQQILTADEGPTVWAVLDEAVLRRPLAGPDLCRAQLTHLLELAERPNVAMQVATFEHGAHPATGGPFTILRFAARELPDVVYLEQLDSALYLDKVREVDGYSRAWDRLCAHIEPPENTTRILSGIRSQL